MTEELFEPGDYFGIESEKVRNEFGNILTLDGVNIEISLGSLGKIDRGKLDLGSGFGVGSIRAVAQIDFFRAVRNALRYNALD